MLELLSLFAVIHCPTEASRASLGTKGPRAGLEPQICVVLQQLNSDFQFIFSRGEFSGNADALDC